MKIEFYTRAVIIFFSCLLFFICLILAFNYYYDGGNQFFYKQKFEKKLTDALSVKNDVLICNNYDTRSFKKKILAKMTSRPKILILGSSRTMSIRHDFFNNTSFYNASVPSATLEDDIGFYYIYQKKGWKPDILVIGLDQWILNN